MSRDVKTRLSPDTPKTGKLAGSKSGMRTKGSVLGSLRVADAAGSLKEVPVRGGSERGNPLFPENYGVNAPAAIREAKGYDKLSGNGTNIYQPGARRFTSKFQKQ